MVGVMWDGVLNRCEGLKVGGYGCSVGTKERRLETQARSCEVLQFVFRVLTFPQEQ